MQQWDSSVSWDLEITSAVLFNSYTGCPYGRVLYEQCILMYKINCGQAPKYITDLGSTVAATIARSDLWSRNTTNYSLGFELQGDPKKRTPKGRQGCPLFGPPCKFGEQAYSYAGTARLHRTFVHRPLWTFLNRNWRHIYIQKLLIKPINIFTILLF